MPDNPIGIFGPDDDDDFGQGPIIDVTPRKEEPEFRETDGHILDDMLRNQRLDRSDRTLEDPDESFGKVVGGVEMNGKRTAIEVELTDKHLIENIQRDYEAGCELIIIAASSQAKIRSYKKKIGMYSKDFLEMVEFRVLTDFLP
jgi:hypothetical protein